MVALFSAGHVRRHTSDERPARKMDLRCGCRAMSQKIACRQVLKTQLGLRTPAMKKSMDGAPVIGAQHFRGADMIDIDPAATPSYKIVAVPAAVRTLLAGLRYSCQNV